jgi:hypothetical protein
MIEADPGPAEGDLDNSDRAWWSASPTNSLAQTAMDFHDPATAKKYSKALAKASSTEPR